MPNVTAAAPDCHGFFRYTSGHSATKRTCFKNNLGGPSIRPAAGDFYVLHFTGRNVLHDCHQNYCLNTESTDQPPENEATCQHCFDNACEHHSFEEYCRNVRPEQCRDLSGLSDSYIEHDGLLTHGGTNLGSYSGFLSIEFCKNRCDETPNCNSFAWCSDGCNMKHNPALPPRQGITLATSTSAHDTSRTCKTYYRDLDTAGRNNEWKWYEMHRRECPTYAPFCVTSSGSGHKCEK